MQRRRWLGRPSNSCGSSGGSSGGSDGGGGEALAHATARRAHGLTTGVAVAVAVGGGVSVVGVVREVPAAWTALGRSCCNASGGNGGVQCGSGIAAGCRLMTSRRRNHTATAHVLALNPRGCANFRCRRCYPRSRCRWDGGTCRWQAWCSHRCYRGGRAHEGLWASRAHGSSGGRGRNL